ncbi:DUF484 family protein [Vibrio sp. JC009]|uniref:DUF484 family protein n=1 Tax=Vibrio sp. JC009 TaxID=2912314 RepID=UPI0023B0CD0E|nr:DUF484 family protein [Vibrio sp. JC009]WED21775.1 DUF484 family protein [Vibrio sp. JC009]
MSQIEAGALSAEIVEEYLRDHPDFLKNRPALIEKLSLSHKEQGAVSLVEIQLRRQREKIAELEEEITQLMSLAAKNDKTFYEFMELQEQVLKCSTVNELITAVAQKAASLGLKGYVRLIDSPEKAHYLSYDNWHSFAASHFNGKDAYLGRLRKADRELLFGNESVPELGSYVVLSLTKHKPLGVIAFSSEDGGHFQPNMDTLFLKHLALTVSHLVSCMTSSCGDTDHVIEQTPA